MKRHLGWSVAWLATIVGVCAGVVCVVGCQPADSTPALALPPTATVAPSVTLPAATRALVPPTGTLAPTATSTSEPTPTAAPLTIRSGNLVSRPAAPEPSSGAPCGVVDTLDFPINPPDADDVAFGGGDFGVYRAGVGAIHAGEDWWRYSDGRSNFGVRVHSIGHGVVTHAEPLGWGVDQGTVVVRHTFPDGANPGVRHIYSFYGHLDPSSVVIRPGDCVSRGQSVGAIGQPRGSPHLHFEIRSHMPSRPGPGYWSVDPQSAGWYPPSQFIWDYRLSTSPGVIWARSTTDEPWRSFAWAGIGTVVAFRGSELVGLSLVDGAILWHHPVTGTNATMRISADGESLYVASNHGIVEAVALDPKDDPTGAGTPTSLWHLKLRRSGTPSLLPLPGGGVVVSLRTWLAGISPEGILLWQRDVQGSLSTWAETPRGLLTSVSWPDTALWAIGRWGPITRTQMAVGQPLVAGSSVLVASEDGVYRVDPEALSASLVLPLAKGYPQSGDAIALPDGGALMARRDVSDHRLIALDADGSLRWQRSYRGRLYGEQRLLAAAGDVYLVSVGDVGGPSEVAVYAVDLETAELASVFRGGTRQPRGRSTAQVVEDRYILVNLGGVSIALLDPQAARAAD